MFGLVRGVGFARSLSSLGLSVENSLHLIVAFNIGVDGRTVILPFCRRLRSRNVMQPWPVAALV